MSRKKSMRKKSRKVTGVRKNQDGMDLEVFAKRIGDFSSFIKEAEVVVSSLDDIVPMDFNLVEFAARCLLLEGDDYFRTVFNGSNLGFRQVIKRAVEGSDRSDEFKLRLVKDVPTLNCVPSTVQLNADSLDEVVYYLSYAAVTRPNDVNFWLSHTAESHLESLLVSARRYAKVSWWIGDDDLKYRLDMFQEMLNKHLS